MENYNLLPIGTVVRLKEAEKRLMIVGILPRNEEKSSDYIALLFPEGYVDSKTFFAFDNDDIKDVEFIGFVDSEYQMFRKTLYEKLNEETDDVEE